MLKMEQSLAVKSNLDQLHLLYDTMDRVYSEIARFYNFSCSRCDSNCCRTLFYHYTTAEHLYLRRGFSALNGTVREEIISRANALCEKPGSKVYLCPLNVHGQCILYPFRPMICRLHGLPYELLRNDGKKKGGPGCMRFENERIRKKLPLRKIDRTPFYVSLANLEMAIRDHFHFEEKFKKTIAEMIRDAGRLTG